MANGDAVPESWQAVLGPLLAAPEARRLGGFLKAEEAAVGRAVKVLSGLAVAGLAQRAGTAEGAAAALA